MEKKKRGPKPGTPSPLKFNFTPEALADFQHRYEVLGQAAASIARDYGMEETTIRRLASHKGWHRPPPAPRDLPAVVRLQRDVEALAARMQEAQENGAAVPPGEGEGATPAGQAPDFAPAIDALLREVMAEIARVRAARLGMKNLPEKPADAKRTASTLASLTRSLHDLQRMSSATAQAFGYDDDDDMPTDLDAFRIDLARRIDAFVESRTQSGDAGGDPAAATVEGVQP